MSEIHEEEEAAAGTVNPRVMEIHEEEEAADGSINPLLLTSACKGFWEALEFLFQREDAQYPPMRIPTEDFRAVLDNAYERIGESAPPDAELAVDQQPAMLAAGALLLGVTPDGNNALHVVARYGDDQDFLKSARLICRRDSSLLLARNHCGETPLHCARRAGNTRMVYHLSDLARHEASPRNIKPPLSDLAGHEASPRNINPLLLASARVGSWEALDVLLQRDPRMMIPTEIFCAMLLRARRKISVPDARDVELGVYHQLASLATQELLQGITPGGDTALHVVASNGDDLYFLKYASMIDSKDRGLLFAKNHNGDTPLHCAARAGLLGMVSHLIDLAGYEGHDRKLTLLRMENNSHETALHEAVRIEYGRVLGPKDREALLYAEGAPEERTIVEVLMAADPHLANYPADGTSPLYLAILMEKSTIAVTLYRKSHGNLSYPGPDGQNALHVAVLRDSDPDKGRKSSRES